MPDHVTGRDRRSGAEAQTADLALDRVRGEGRNDSVRVGATADVERIHLGSGPDEACRWFDEPVIGQGEIVSGRCRDGPAIRADLLAEQAYCRIGQVGAVEFPAHHEVGEKPAIGRNQVSAEKWHLEIGRTAL